ncbi:transporter [Shinella sp. SUS2]|uniref:EamA family transporter n=1 Tax=unclassified Shinella TaxID=2643062 RepID=UPI000682265F|nr:MULTISPECIES: EamA family transporter [unclassified Shinella]KNY17558.1 transporter [Shinella sp. SUS2]KOC75020.1 transporter [Shinella sp. GWS1]
MKAFLTSWQLWALGSAVFAALTAVFAKIGISEVNSDFATFVRTVVILLALALMLTLAGNWQAPGSLPARSWIFLILSGLATGASWLCYFRALQIGKAAQVAPVDKLSVVLVAIFAVLFLGEQLSTAHWIAVLMIGGGALLLALPI